MQKRLLTAWALLCFALASAQPTTNGLVLYLPMNGNYTDAGPGNITVTGTGGLTPVTNFAGTANSALSFLNPPGGLGSATQTQYGTVALNAATSFATGTNFTVAHFFKINSLPASGGAGMFDNQLNAGGYGSWCWRSGAVIQVNFNCRGNALQSPPATVPVNYNTWYHLAVTRNGGTLTMYINGAPVASVTEGTINPSYTFPARIGTMNYQQNGGTLFYNGLDGALDELRVYNRTLSAGEIAVLATSSSALPLQLSRFTAVKKDEAVLLQWTTQWEQNSSHVNILRSTDGLNFSSIGTVPAHGTTAAASDYEYLDNTLKGIGTATVYYRLQLVDKDGRSQQGSTVSVKYQGAGGLITLLQNPVVNELRLQVTLPQKETIQLRVTDATGRTALLQQLSMKQGQTFTALPVETLAAGTYYLNVRAGNSTQTLAFVKN